MTFALLNAILERLNSGNSDIDSLLPLFDGESWMPTSPGECQSCDMLFALAHQKGESVCCGMRGHGLKSNYFNLQFTSPQLMIAISVPYGNLQTEDMPLETENLRCIIAALTLFFRILNGKKDTFLPDDNASLCLRCQDFETAFQIRIGDEITREGDSWIPLLNMVDAAMNKEETRLYV